MNKEVNKSRIVNNFIEFVQISSETKNEYNFAMHLKSKLEKMGFHIEMDNAGVSFGGNSGNLIAKLKGEIRGLPLLFSAHMDTVKPGIGINPIIKDDIIYSDGTTILGGDDKAGIACILEGIQTIIDLKVPHRDLELLFTVGEEGGINGGKYLDLSLLTAKQGFILDSSKLPGEIITQSPGQAKLDITIHGKAAHAGVCPEAGISAVQIFSHAVQHMKLLRIDEETTANIGMVQGGSATNIVMPELNITAEVRSLSEKKLKNQILHMKNCFESASNHFGGSFTFKDEIMYGAFNVSETDEVVKQAKEAFEILGIKATTTFTGGGSDANVLNARGLTMINLGIGEKAAHTLNEHYYIKDLLTMSAFVATLIKLQS